MKGFPGKVLLAAAAGSMLLVAAPAIASEFDYNGDGAVDDADQQIIEDARNTYTGHPDFVPAADHDGDGQISLVDLNEFVKARRAQDQ